MHKTEISFETCVSVVRTGQYETKVMACKQIISILNLTSQKLPFLINGGYNSTKIFAEIAMETQKNLLR